MRDPRNWPRAALRPGRGGAGGLRRGGRPRRPAHAPQAPQAARAGRTPRSISPSARCATSGARRCACSRTRRPNAERADPFGRLARTTGAMAQELGVLADEDLMQLVRRGDARAFEIVYERHCLGRLLARLPHGGHAQRRRGRLAGGVPEPLALRRALRPRPRLGPHLGARASSTTGRSTTCAAPTVHDKRRASDEGIEERFEARRAHRRRGRAPRRGADRALRHGRCRPSSARSSSSPTSAASPTRRSRSMLETPVGTVKGRMRLGLKKMRRAARPAGR